MADEMTLLSSGEQVQFHEANEGDSEKRRGLQGVLNQTHCLTYSVRRACCCSLACTLPVPEGITLFMLRPSD